MTRPSSESNRSEGPCSSRILICSHVRLYREGLALLLAREEDLEIAGQAENLDALLAEFQRVDVDIVLLDIAAAESLEEISTIVSALHETPCVAIGVRELAGDVIACVEAGVVGYVPRNESIDYLMEAVRAALANEAHVSPKTAFAMFARLRQNARSVSSELPDLTRRELEIADLIGRGLQNKEIAQELQISTSTVKHHVHHLLHKLGATSRAKVAAMVRPRFDRHAHRRSSA